MGISQEELDIYNGAEQPTRTEKDIDLVFNKHRRASEAFDASFELGWKSTFVGAANKMIALNDADNGGNKIAPMELNKLYPNMPAPFTEHMTKTQAQFIFDQHQEKQELQEAINKGPDGLFYGGVNMAASIAAHMLDPVEVGAGYLTGPLLGFATQGTRLGAALGVSKVAARGRLAAMGVKHIPSTAGASALQKAAFNMIEGTIGNIAAEVPIVAMNSKMLEDYTALDAFVSTAGGAIGFSALGFLGSKGARFLSDMNLNDQLMINQVAWARAEKFGTSNVSPAIKDLAMRTNAKPRSRGVFGGAPYKYEPHTKGNGKDFYVVFDGQNNGVDLQRQSLTGERYANKSETLMATDSDLVANGAGSNGDIHKVNIDDVNLINLNQITEEGQILINGIVHRHPQLSKYIPVEGITPKDFLDDLHIAVTSGAVSPKVLDDFIDEMQVMKYDGFVNDGSKLYGAAHNQHNSVTIFKGAIDKVKFKGRVKGQPQLVPRISEADRIKESTRLNSPDNHIDYDPGLVKDMENLKASPKGEEVISEIKADSQRVEEQFKVVKDAAPEDLKPEFEEIEKAANEIDAMGEAMDIASNCIGGMK